MELLYLLDLIGTAAFAISGAFSGIKSKVDLSGVLLAGILTAVGGGTLRDVFLFNEEIFWIQDMTYVYVALIGAFFTFLYPPHFAQKFHLYRFLDAVGLGVFTVIGVQKGIEHNFPILVVIFCGMLPAIGGGLLRGIVLGETPPYVLRAGFYGSSALCGAILYIILAKGGLNTEINLFFSAGFIILVRMYSASHKWKLPKSKGV